MLDSPTSAGGCLSTATESKESRQGQPYPGNQIPVSTFDPAGLKLASTYIPLSTDPCGKTFFGYLANNPDNQWIGRIDYVVSSKAGHLRPLLHLRLHRRIALQWHQRSYHRHRR